MLKMQIHNCHLMIPQQIFTPQNILRFLEFLTNWNTCVFPAEKVGLCFGSLLLEICKHWSQPFYFLHLHPQDNSIAAICQECCSQKGRYFYLPVDGVA